MNQTPGILFDLDGTLLDTAPDLAHAANTLYHQYGLPQIDYEILRPLASDGALAFIHQGFGLNHRYTQVLRNEFIQIYLSVFGQHTALFEGIADLLTQLIKADYPWGIVTNKPTQLTSVTLAHFPVLAQAKVVVSGDTLKTSKPDPAPVFYACHKLQRPPSACYFVGDHERDIIAGQKAGTKTIVAEYGYIPTNENPEDWHADYRVDSVEKLSTLLYSF
jgi:N-acetyl-D-muramate 6-phosphate phosphatase